MVDRTTAAAREITEATRQQRFASDAVVTAMATVTASGDRYRSGSKGHAVAARRLNDLAEREIQAWPRTDGLGMTPRSQELINEIITRASQLGYSASTSDTLSPDPPTRVL